MLIISHRGNINGIDIDRENNPSHVLSLLDKNIPVEIDVWLIDGNWSLGHDKPIHSVDISYLKHPLLWCHAKNIQALEEMVANNIHCFWHEEDNYTLTSKGIIWTYPGVLTTKNTVIVDTSKDWKTKKYSCKGVCVDYL